MKGGSYAWKSILGAREVVKQELIWHIGDGANVSIKEDKWLPDPCYRKVSSPLPSIPPEAKVSSLIDCNSGTWKKEDIKQLFLPHKADAIISIPLSLRMPTDRLVWSKTPSGNFSSRSAYRLFASNASATNPSSSNPIPQRSFWRGIWMLCVPHKVKHFTLRACNNSLLTMDNLL